VYATLPPPELTTGKRRSYPVWISQRSFLVRYADPASQGFRKRERLGPSLGAEFLCPLCIRFCPLAKRVAHIARLPVHLAAEHACKRVADNRRRHVDVRILREGE